MTLEVSDGTEWVRYFGRRFRGDIAPWFYWLNAELQKIALDPNNNFDLTVTIEAKTITLTPQEAERAKCPVEWHFIARWQDHRGQLTLQQAKYLTTQIMGWAKGAVNKQLNEFSARHHLKLCFKRTPEELAERAQYTRV